MEDEGLLLSNPQLAPAAVDRLEATLGVDVVRIHARWWEIAPQRDRCTSRRGFHADEPERPAVQLGALDNAVAIVRDAGMRVMLTITGPGPAVDARATRARTTRAGSPRRPTTRDFAQRRRDALRRRRSTAT